MTLVRLESFPFDSRYDGYDDNGYPVYDRAVGADTMRETFAHFFKDGVFSDGTYPFRLTKAASGLAVTVNPGTAIIEGAMGTFGEAMTLTLAEGTTAGVTKYAVFLRYDNNDEYRSIYLRTDASSAGGAVPEPVSKANVVEYRIGYITVPSNASDLSGATVTNEVGTSMCPYAVPLFDINPAEVLEDLKADAQAAYDTYYALLASSIDDTTAGNLQNQISENESRIATLEENQFTQEDIDAQALRAEMGLGNTLGVVEEAHGGTGETDLAEAIASKGVWFAGESSKSGNTLIVKPPFGVPSDWAYIRVSLMVGLTWIEIFPQEISASLEYLYYSGNAVRSTISATVNAESISLSLKSHDSSGTATGKCISVDFRK